MTSGAPAADGVTTDCTAMGGVGTVVKAVQVLRTISLRQWGWATCIAAVFLLAYVMGILKDVLGIGAGPTWMHGWRAPEITTTVVTGILGSYFFLFAIRFAEFPVPGGLVAWRRYAVATAIAIVASVALETTLIALLPSERGWNFVPDLAAMIPKVTWSAANWLLSGGLAVAVYVRFQSARRARQALEAAEIECAVSSRELVATRLAAMQARVEPQFLLSILTQIEALYDRDAESADGMLESLIAYLRAALPQLRGDDSTVEREARLCGSYLRLAQLRMGSRLVFSIEIPDDLGPKAFPPMLLLPLIDDALRNGLEPLPFGGRIELHASADADHLRVVVTHDGVIPPKDPTRTSFFETLSERLEGLYGSRAVLGFSDEPRQGVKVVLELPNEAARDYR